MQLHVMPTVHSLNTFKVIYLIYSRIYLIAAILLRAYAQTASTIETRWYPSNKLHVVGTLRNTAESPKTPNDYQNKRGKQQNSVEGQKIIIFSTPLGSL